MGGVSCRYAGLPEYPTHSVFDVFFTPPCTLAFLSFKVGGGRRVIDAETCFPLPVQKIKLDIKNGGIVLND